MEGVLKRANKIAGTTTAASVITAVLKLDLAVHGTIDGISSTSGALTIGETIDLVGSIPATSDVASQIGVVRCIDGVVTSASTTNGALNIFVPLSGELNAVSGIGGDTTLIKKLIASLVGSSAMSGGLAATYSVGGIVEGGATAQATLSVDTGAIMIRITFKSLTPKRTIAHL